MTVETTDRRVPYTGDGVQTTFAYKFKVIEATHMVVYLDGTVTGDYTITGVGENEGGSVIFNMAPADQVAILLQREVPRTQEIDYRPYDSFPSEVAENGYDLLTMMIQELEEVQGRRMTYPDSDPTGLNYELPAVADRANKFVTHDAQGNVNVADGAASVPVSPAMAPVVGAATVEDGATQMKVASLSQFSQMEADAGKAGTMDVLTFGTNVAVDLTRGNLKSIAVGAGAWQFDNPATLYPTTVIVWATNGAGAAIPTFGSVYRVSGIYLVTENVVNILEMRCDGAFIDVVITQRVTA